LVDVRHISRGRVIEVIRILIRILTTGGPGALIRCRGHDHNIIVSPPGLVLGAHLSIVRDSDGSMADFGTVKMIYIILICIKMYSTR
jgi:hypothetical protein